MQENTDQKNSNTESFYTVFFGTSIELMHKWYPLEIQNFLPPLPPVLRHLGSKKPCLGMSPSTSTPSPWKKNHAHVHAHTHTLTHIHTLIDTTLKQTTNVVPANSLFTGLGWEFIDLMLFMSRQETNKLSWKLRKYVIDVLHMYITSISTKLTNDNGKMVLFNEWYKLDKEVNTTVYMN